MGGLKGGEVELSKADVNEQVDLALDTAVPASPTADSLNERVKAVDVLTEASGDGDLAAIKTEVDTHPTLAEIEASTVLALKSQLLSQGTNDLNATCKGSINAEVDGALNTAVPASPTADSVNQRIVAIDDLTQGSGAGDLSAIKTETDSHPTLAEIEASTVIALKSQLVSQSGVDISATTKDSINTEVDGALNTAVPGSPTADSINERVAAVDDLTQSSGAGDLAAIKTETDSHPTLSEIEASAVLALKANLVNGSGDITPPADKGLWNALGDGTGSVSDVHDIVKSGGTGDNDATYEQTKIRTLAAGPQPIGPGMTMYLNIDSGTNGAQILAVLVRGWVNLYWTIDVYVPVTDDVASPAAGDKRSTVTIVGADTEGGMLTSLYVPGGIPYNMFLDITNDDMGEQTINDVVIVYKSAAAMTATWEV